MESIPTGGNISTNTGYISSCFFLRLGSGLVQGKWGTLLGATFKVWHHNKFYVNTKLKTKQSLCPQSSQWTKYQHVKQREDLIMHLFDPERDQFTRLTLVLALTKLNLISGSFCLLFSQSGIFLSEPCIVGSFSLFRFFFYVDHFKSLYWICYNIVSVLWFWCFGHKACETLVPRPRIKPLPSALENEVLTTLSICWCCFSV